MATSGQAVQMTGNNELIYENRNEEAEEETIWAAVLATQLQKQAIRQSPKMR